MSPKSLKRVAIALVVVVFLWGAAELFMGRGDQVEQDMTVPPMTADRIDTIEYAHDTVDIVLTKGQGRWWVNAYPAAPDVVAATLSRLGIGIQGELIARTTASHARMGVDSTGARFRVVGGGKVVTDLIVGGVGAGVGGRYVRPAGGDRVYLIQADAAELFNRSFIDWRDRKVVVLDTSQVGSVAVERGKERYTLVRRDSAWTLAGDGPADVGPVARMLGQLRSIEGQSESPFATDAQVDSTDFTRPDRRVTVLGMNGDTLAKLVFDSTANGFWVRHDSGGIVYKLYSWKVNEMLPKDSTLRPKKP